MLYPTDNEVLWRYLDLPRYLDLLIKEKLFFPCATVLEDPFEGILWGNGNFYIRTQDAPMLAISSWHSNPEENYAMWKIYAQGYNGLAIQSDYLRLKKSFLNAEKKILIGKVKYFDEDPIDSMEDHLGAVFQKRSIYSFEQEVRCCYRLDSGEKSDHIWEEQGHVHGVYIPVNLDTLIDKLYISPYSPKWFRELVAGINKRFQISKEIIHSAVFAS